MTSIGWWECLGYNNAVTASHDLSSESLATSSETKFSVALEQATADSKSGPGRWMGADPLSNVLRTVRLTGALFFLIDHSSPWADEVPAARGIAPILLPGAQQIISYHVVREGRCWARLLDGPPLELTAGDLLLIPHGDTYVISSSPETRITGALEPALTFFQMMADGEFPTAVTEGGGGSECARLICGFLGCDVRPFNPVLASLPRLVRLRQTPEPGADRLAHLIEFALAESREASSGGQCVLLRLSELMFVEVLRRYLVTAPVEQTGWLAGLRDPIVGQALALLHNQPAFAWTLEKLAKSAGASRSTLADRFTHFVGLPPMQYLAQWRMELAARLLSDGAAKVSAVALEVGYESEAAFSRAFKKIVGVPPAVWRKQASDTI